MTFGTKDTIQFYQQTALNFTSTTTRSYTQLSCCMLYGVCKKNQFKSTVTKAAHKVKLTPGVKLN